MSSARAFTSFGSTTAERSSSTSRLGDLGGRLGFTTTCRDHTVGLASVRVAHQVDCPREHPVCTSSPSRSRRRFRRGTRRQSVGKSVGERRSPGFLRGGQAWLEPTGCHLYGASLSLLAVVAEARVAHLDRRDADQRRSSAVGNSGCEELAELVGAARLVGSDAVVRDAGADQRMPAARPSVSDIVATARATASLPTRRASTDGSASSSQPEIADADDRR